MNGTGLVRRPSSRLPEGIVTHISRTTVDVALARAQHAAYADALAASGWLIQQAPADDDCPNSVFIEEHRRGLRGPGGAGAPGRGCPPGGGRRCRAGRPVAGPAAAACIEEPGVLEGVRRVAGQATRQYVGRGPRTNGEGIRQLRSLLAPLGRTVIAVPLGKVLHLKSAVTALPDGTFLPPPELVPAWHCSRRYARSPKRAAIDVVPLGGDRVLIAASAPRTAEFLDDLGFTPTVVDISEFEKLEGCVTCLSVLLPGTVEPVTSSVLGNSAASVARRCRTGISAGSVACVRRDSWLRAVRCPGSVVDCR